MWYVALPRAALHGDTMQRIVFGVRELVADLGTGGVIPPFYSPFVSSLPSVTCFLLIPAKVAAGDGCKISCESPNAFYAF